MKYKITQNSMRLRNVEVLHGFSQGNLFVQISYRCPNADWGIEATLGSGNGDREILVLLNQKTDKGDKGAFFRLYLTPKERAASNGPGWVRSCDYIGTSLHFCPTVTEEEWDKAKRAVKV